MVKHSYDDVFISWAEWTLYMHQGSMHLLSFHIDASSLKGCTYEVINLKWSFQKINFKVLRDFIKRDVVLVLKCLDDLLINHNQTYQSSQS